MSFEKNLETPTIEKKESGVADSKKESFDASASADIAKNYKQVTETLDVVGKSRTDLEADISHFKEQIKIGETKDEHGNYNEKLILENEAKLREAEKLLASHKEAKEASVIETDLKPKEKGAADLEADIKYLREQIKVGETKDERGQYNEKLVLESEAKLRLAEKKLNLIKEDERLTAEIKQEEENIKEYRENIKLGETKDERGQYNEEMVLENEAKLRESEKKIKELLENKESLKNQESEVLDSEKISEIVDELKDKAVESEENVLAAMESVLTKPKDKTHENMASDNHYEADWGSQVSSSKREEKKPIYKDFWKRLFNALRK